MSITPISGNAVPSVPIEAAKPAPAPTPATVLKPDTVAISTAAHAAGKAPANDGDGDAS